MDRTPAEARALGRARDRRARRGHRAQPAAAARVGGALLRRCRRHGAARPGRRRGSPVGEPDRGRGRVGAAGIDVVVHVEPRRRGLDLRDRVLAIALAEPLVREAHDITIFEQDDARLRLAAPEVPAGVEPHRSGTGRRPRRAGDRASCPRSPPCRRTWSHSSDRSPSGAGRRQRRQARRARDRTARARAHGSGACAS